MAEKRMFAKSIIDSDAFLDMPLSAQALYFHLSMRADDDGFVNNPKKIQRMIGSADDDLKLLFMKMFVIPFESGICVIRHWKIHNYIQNDRYHETAYQNERNMLEIGPDKTYTVKSVSVLDTPCIQDASKMEAQIRLDEIRLDKSREIDKSISCAVPEIPATTPKEEIEIELPLNDKTVYQVTKAQVHQWEGLYPAVDVSQALRGMKGWLDARPDKRKTRRGISRFINGWLAREQDKGGNKRGGQGLGNASVSQNCSGETPEGTCGKQYGNWL